MSRTKHRRPPTRKRARRAAADTPAPPPDDLREFLADREFRRELRRLIDEARERAAAANIECEIGFGIVSSGDAEGMTFHGATVYGARPVPPLPRHRYRATLTLIGPVDSEDG